MSTTEEENRHQTGIASDQGPKPIAEFVIALWVLTNLRRRFCILARLSGAGTMLAFIIAITTPKEYLSTAKLMPPDAQSLSSPSVLGALTGTSIFGPSLGGGLLSSTSLSGTIIGILGSQTVQDDIIKRFDLLKVYHVKLYVDARKELTERTALEEEKKSGILDITVKDRDPYRARDIAGAYIEELSNLVSGLNTSSSRRERIFLEERLKTVKNDLDVSSRELSNFSSHSRTLDVQKQGEATVEAAGRLQGELIATQTELSGLKTRYSDDNVRVRQARAQVDELQSQLRKMSGAGESANGAELRSDQFLPSIRELPILGVTYYDLYRRVSMQESIYETLTKQYELAKVEEAKEIPPVRVLDRPSLPERKSSPRRMFIVALGFAFSFLAAVAWILASALWRTTKDSHPVKAGIFALFHTIRNH